MELERDTVVEIVAAVGGAGLFVAILLFIGAEYNRSGLSGDGALAVIGAILLFILVMTAIGFWLSTRQQ